MGDEHTWGVISSRRTAEGLNSERLGNIVFKTDMLGDGAYVDWKNLRGNRKVNEKGVTS